MPIPLETFPPLEDTINRLAAESVLAQSGRDEGLIPAYSLLGELTELSGAEPQLVAVAEEEGFFELLCPGRLNKQKKKQYPQVPYHVIIICGKGKKLFKTGSGSRKPEVRIRPQATSIKHHF